VAVQLATLATMTDWVAAASIIALAASAHVLVRNNRLKAKLDGLQKETEATIENLTEGFYRASMDGKLSYANPALAAINGFSNPSDLIEAVNASKGGFYVEPGRRAEFLKEIRSTGHVKEFVSEAVCAGDHKRIWVTENARAVHDPKSGAVLHYEGTVRDVTDFVMRMREKEALIKLTSQVPGGLFQMERQPGGNFEVLFTSPGFRELLDRQDADRKFDINRFLSIIHPDDLPEYNESLKASRKQMAPWTNEFRVVTDGGKPKWMRVQATPEKFEDGRIVWHGYLQDVTALKADEAQIRQMAYNDTLTGLPNRRLLLDRLQQSIAANGRRNEQGAVLFIDIDNFKLLNDTHGHDTGDQLLAEIARRLRKLVRKSDTVARLAGDEFVVLLEGLGRDRATAEQKASAIGSKILSVLVQPFHDGKVKHVATASVGGVCFDGSAKSVDEIIKNADTAMYAAKKSGRNAFRMFEPAKPTENGQQIRLADDLKHIVSDKQIVLRLQPQVNRDGHTCGAEALLRWNHPKLGLLAPEKFIELAERRGIAGDINAYVLEHAAKLLGAWQADPEMCGLRLAVNIGSDQLFDPELPRSLRELFKRHGAPASLLTLEFTEESIAKSRDEAMKAMARLKTTGVRLSLDDFGTGYSSLAQLKDMPLSEIKIDGRFIRHMHDRPKDAALVKTMLSMAETLGLDAVAEHVETAAQEKFLLKHGCTLYQGFLYSGAMTRGDFEESVRQANARRDETESMANVA
jgi:diguanylate cyclase (GGDEF)-like protein